MSETTGATRTSVLNTAGISPDVYGEQIAMDMPNESVYFGLVNRYTIGRGATLYIPKVGIRSATARTRDSDQTPDQITFKELDDSAATFTKRMTYNAIQWSYGTNNDLEPNRLRLWLGAEGKQASAGLANDFDSTLGGLYASASSSVGDSASDVSRDMLREILSKLKQANLRGPFWCTLPTTQTDHLYSLIDTPNTGVVSVLDMPQNPVLGAADARFHNLFIYLTGNVPTAGGAAHGLAGNGDSVHVAIRDFMEVEEWKDPDTMSYKVNVWTDWAYSLPFSDHVVDVQTTDS